MSKKPSNPKCIDFVIVGQPKSGTTAMASFLGQHPEVCMSMPKEPHYFATDHHRESDKFHGGKVYYHTRSQKDFRDLFSHANSDERIFGEASTGYLYSLEAAKNIYKNNPNAKIIAMFRDPVTFLHSLHMQYVNETVENETDFEKALSLEKPRKSNPDLIPKNVRCPSYLYYSERYKYAEQLQRYLDIFPRENILVLTHEGFLADNAGVFQEVVEFLGIKPYKPDFKTVHGSKAPRWPTLNHLIHNPKLKTYVQKITGQKLYTKIHKKLNKVLLKPQQRTTLSHSLEKRLRKDTRKEVDNFSKILGEDFLKPWGYTD